MFLFENVIYDPSDHSIDFIPFNRTKVGCIDEKHFQQAQSTAGAVLPYHVGSIIINQLMVLYRLGLVDQASISGLGRLEGVRAVTIDTSSLHSLW